MKTKIFSILQHNFVKLYGKHINKKLLKQIKKMYFKKYTVILELLCIYYVSLLWTMDWV